MKGPVTTSAYPPPRVPLWRKLVVLCGFASLALLAVVVCAVGAQSVREGSVVDRSTPAPRPAATVTR